MLRCGESVSLGKSGSRGTRAEQGSAPQFMRLLLCFGLDFGWGPRFGIPERGVAGGDFRRGAAQLRQPTPEDDLRAEHGIGGRPRGNTIKPGTHPLSEELLRPQGGGWRDDE